MNTKITNANIIFFIPKNTAGQAKLRANWIKKKVNGKRFPFVIPPFKNNKKEIPIIIYKTIHTGVKIQSGGFKKGLFKLSNQSMFFII